MQVFFYPTEKIELPIDVQLSYQLNGLVSHYGPDAVRSAIEQVVFLEEDSEYLLVIHINNLLNYYGKDRLLQISSIHFPSLAA